MTMYIVLADFHAEEEEELSLSAGCAVEVLRFGEDGWADVVYQQTVGICPNAYLKLATEVEIPEALPDDTEQIPEAVTPSPAPATARAANRNAGRPLPAPGGGSQAEPTAAPSGASTRGTAARGTRGTNAPSRGGAPRGGATQPPRGTPRGTSRGAPRGTTRGAVAAPRGQAPARGTRGAPRARGERGAVQARGERGGAPRGSTRRPAPQSRREKSNNKPPGTTDPTEQAVAQEEAQETELVEELSVEENSDSSASADDSAKREAQRKHRKMVLAEILQTERDYVNDIEIVAVVFIRPLLEKNIISREDHTLLFSNLEVLVHVNQQLLNRLTSEEDLECLRVGILFLEMAEYFKTYASYCANQPKFIATLNRLNEENHTFDQYLYEQTKNEQCRGLDLFSFLIKPIQRICKYPLLLRDLLKVTPDDHFDREDLLKALVKIEEVVSYVNDRKRLAENLQKILDVQDQIESNVELSLVEPSRRFVREGSLHVVENGRVRDRNTYVFNDLIVLTKPKRSMMGYAAKDHFKAQLYLNDIKIVDMADTEEVKNACQVLPKNEDKKFDFVFMFDSSNEKAEWVKEIKTLVREFQLKELRAAQEAKAKREEEEASSAPVVNTSSSRRQPAATESSSGGASGGANSSPMPRRQVPTRGGSPSIRGPSFHKPAPPGQGRNLTGRPTNSPTPPPTQSGAKGMLKSFFR